MPFWAARALVRATLTGGPERRMKLQKLDHVAVNVTDVRRSARWYQEVLGLERMYEAAWGDYPALVVAGSTGIALFPVEDGTAKPPPGRDVLTMRHLAFRVDGGNFRQAQDELRARGIEFRSSDHQVSHSVYFHDPDGHEIELTTYDV